MIELIPNRTSRLPTKLYFCSGRYPVVPHHLQFTLNPFFRNLAQHSPTFFPTGVDLISVDEHKGTLTIHPEDYFLWYQPQPEQQKILDRIIFPETPSPRHAIVCYENPVGYSWRRWMYRSHLIKRFPVHFSSVRAFVNDHSKWWIPAWNYAYDFARDIPVDPHESNCSSRQKRMVLNPITGGVGVNPQRIEIIAEMLNANIELDMYGNTTQFASEPWNRWQHRYVGPIPFTSAPYKYRAKLPVYSQYDFTLTIENLFADWYMTEKLAEPFAALSVPVYYGNPAISKLLPQLFTYGAIDGFAYQSTVALCDYLRELGPRDLELRREVIRSERNKYFKLTSYRRIWDFVLSKVFGATIPEHSLFLKNINTRFAVQNRNDQAQSSADMIERIVSETEDDSAYDRTIKQLLFTQAMSSTDTDISDILGS